MAGIYGIYGVKERKKVERANLGRLYCSGGHVMLSIQVQAIPCQAMMVVIGPHLPKRTLVNSGRVFLIKNESRSSLVALCYEIK